ncbi:fibrinogen-like protein 1-like protein isoform X1 [Erpetoichthys calabaricus]|uniref:fibrinogen-like protein 1-like protein isoform X1 n=1 Tax=Erpetoichthys calabaricus TaxID=27687 RepID=UPI002233E680|nr:fibrinogen-like protein 1-like protein isoform X1 [Erpetoichthys calabaricus]
MKYFVSLDAVINILAVLFLTAVAHVIQSDALQINVANANLLHDDAIKVHNLRIGRSRTVYPCDCGAFPPNYPDGVYVIQPRNSHPLVVYCITVDNLKWTVIQKNSVSSEIEWRESWTTYKYGFGNIEEDHWLGNEYIHKLTTQRAYKARIVLNVTKTDVRYADYDTFSLDEESRGYALRLGQYSGTAPDYMIEGSIIHDNMKFSTKDKDQDRSSGNCASAHHGGWWYDNCLTVQLNGKGYIYWNTLCHGNCQASLIMIRPSEICQ